MESIEPPRRRENPLARYARDAQECSDPGMREIAYVAFAKNVRASALAALIGVSRTVLLRHFTRDESLATKRGAYGVRKATIKRYQEALGMSPLHIAAARGEVTDKALADALHQLSDAVTVDTPRANLNMVNSWRLHTWISSHGDDPKALSTPLHAYIIARERIRIGILEQPDLGKVNDRAARVWWAERLALLAFANAAALIGMPLHELVTTVGGPAGQESIAIHNWIDYTQRLVIYPSAIEELFKYLLCILRDTDPEFSEAVVDELDNDTNSIVNSRASLGRKTARAILNEVIESRRKSLEGMQ